jgi:uncharacterized RDD family membrane protein YckC
VLVEVQPNPHGYPLAPLGRRLLARLIDIAVVLLLSVAASGWLMYTVVRDYAPLYRAIYRAAMAGQDVSQVALPAVPGRTSTLTTIVIPLIIMVLWWFYEVPATARTGQTLGKRLLGIKVLALETTEPIGIRRAFRRWNPLGVPVFLWSCFGLGFVLQFVDSVSPALGGPLRLALHDRSAATVVVHSSRGPSAAGPGSPAGPPTISDDGPGDDPTSRADTDRPGAPS